MTLAETLVQNRTEQVECNNQRMDMTIPHRGWNITLVTDHADRVGCVLWEIRLDRPAEIDAMAKNSTAWAQQLTGRVSGLLESLRVHEVEAPDHVQLRSSRPTVRGMDRLYYEVTLRGTDHATVRRYCGSTQGLSRAQVEFTLTHEVLEKLLDDVTLSPT